MLIEFETQQRSRISFEIEKNIPKLRCSIEHIFILVAQKEALVENEKLYDPLYWIARLPIFHSNKFSIRISDELFAVNR